jgi:hypothetical protein
MLNTVDPIYLNNNRIDCLLYADDVILLSNSPEGLQAKLDCLDKLCKEWCMSVNIPKTKIITFNKPGRLMKCNFSLNNKTLECVKHYKYLGIYLSCSGSFSEAKNELYEKAVKALYKLKADILSLNPLPKTSTHIFDHTIKPILLYGSEIWGGHLPKKSNWNLLFNYSRLSRLFPCDKLHMHYCKYISGANKKSTNLAILSELGRMLLLLDRFINVIQYWKRLETNPSPS